AAAAAAAASSSSASSLGSGSATDDPVNCRPFANATQYDHLRGIAARISLPAQAEPQVFSIFVQPGKPRPTERDVARAVSERLRASPKSAHALNQAGNLLRYHGRTLSAVECFRKALSVSPNNADVLLNLARVLFNHRYLEDAAYLARRSLETQPANRNAWLQHFTLGEILRAAGHSAEAAHHLRQAISLKPEFKPAQAQLRLLEPAGQSSLTVYTLTIIAFLVLCVLAGLLTTTEANLDAYGEVMKTQRHFNRAMAMRTLRMSINPRLARARGPPAPPPIVASAGSGSANSSGESSVGSSNNKDGNNN
uniref:TPR_REGION domain-containing protein n=2 Tax=Macrostomum lignano TaxID=282301 RepID=A0A1I8J2Q5_9PLAT